LRNGVVVALLAIGLVVGAGIGYVAGTSQKQPVLGNTTAVSSTHATCTTSGPTNGVALMVVANNGSWEGVKVSGEAVGYCNDQRQVTTLGPATTNATGWVIFEDDGLPGIYFLNVTESAFWTYRISVVTEPTTTTYVVLNLTTGNVTTRFCEFNVCQ
jgi:LytS/YehU family sensor histidine kinase